MEQQSGFMQSGEEDARRRRSMVVLRRRAVVYLVGRGGDRVLAGRERQTVREEGSNRIGPHQIQYDEPSTNNLGNATEEAQAAGSRTGAAPALRDPPSRVAAAVLLGGLGSGGGARGNSDGDRDVDWLSTAASPLPVFPQGVRFRLGPYCPSSSPFAAGQVDG